MSQIDRQFYGGASSEGLWVVEYDHTYSGVLGPLGIKAPTAWASDRRDRWFFVPPTC